MKTASHNVVTVYIGPPASGKTTTLEALAKEVDGIRVPWSVLKGYKPQHWKEFAKNNHLIIDEYILNQWFNNKYLSTLASSGIKVTLACQDDSPSITLLKRFEVIRTKHEKGGTHA